MLVRISMRIIDYFLDLKENLLSINKLTVLQNFKNINHLVDNTLSMDEPYNLNISYDNSFIEIKKNVLFRSFCNIMIYANAKLILNDNIFFNNYCSINCLGEIVIGENTIFGEGVKIYDHNHSYSFQENALIVERNDFKIGIVHIGKNCWIGSNVTILANVIIGDNVIVGANNLIYKSLPSNVIVKAKHELIIEPYDNKG